jgi:hypothetical protein
MLLGAASARAVPWTGTVEDRSGRPIQYAGITAGAHKLAAVTDDRGRFRLDLPAGPTTIEVTRIGYRHARLEVTIAAETRPLRVVLDDAPVPVEEVVVVTSSFGKSGESEGAVVRRSDILTTPGGTADVFQAPRALPGINAPDDGAVLYVRGGDPRETLIRLDGAEIVHPYHYESASGGLFAGFDTYVLKSAFFSAGGFSGKYGGVLSGVLDIETQDAMDLRTVSIGANRVGGDVSGSWALIPGRLSAVATARIGTVEILNTAYGSNSTFIDVPSARDGAVRLLYRYSPAGRISLLYLGSSDRVRLYESYLNFDGELAFSARNRFAMIQIQQVLARRIAIKGMAAWQAYDMSRGFGPDAINEHERNGQAGVDALWPASERHEIAFGMSFRHPEDEITGTAAADSTDYYDGAPERGYGTHARLSSPGFYLEDKVRLWGPVYATLGGRLDCASTPGVWTSDPRAALAWRATRNQTLRIAAGGYHQPADPQYLDPVYGNPRLAPLRAEHLIAGYEWSSNAGNIRIEAYRKFYRNLITNDAATFYENGGHGCSRGVDVFLQGAFGSVYGWVSYGYLDSRRKEGNDPREVPSACGVGHAFTLVARYALTPRWRVGARYGFNTGRPYTPVLGRRPDYVRGMWRPVFGEQNSDRLPDYRRLDLRGTREFTLPARLGLPASGACELYVEILNVLDTRNVLDYVYREGYTRRYPTYSYFSDRLAVAGLTLTW